MSDEDHQMDAAIRLYSEESTFAEIANELEVSKSYAQKLVRKGIAKTLDKLGNEKLLEMDNNEKEPENEAKNVQLNDDEPKTIQPNTVMHQPTPSMPISMPQPMVSHQPEFIPPMAMPQPQPSSYADQEYELELTAIPKKITLTAYHIGIFDVFVNGGYTGTLSQFAQDAFVFMFTRTTPQERAN